MNKDAGGASWGYSGEVGEWRGDLVIPADRQIPPIEASIWVIRSLQSALGQIHRPHGLEVSWGEYDAAGTELSFHELDESPAMAWVNVEDVLRSIGNSRGNRVGIGSVLVHLDTEVLAPDPRWMEMAGTLQWSFLPPETAVSSAHVVYSATIDPWLAATYGEDGVARSNQSIAVLNRPRLTNVIAELASRLSDFAAGRSRPYPFAITDAGFADLDITQVPPRFR